MTISRHRTFRKHYKARIAHNETLRKKFQERFLLFLDNPVHPLLRDHALTGRRERLRAFCVTGDIRVVYRRGEEGIELYDIGSHNQVY